MHATCNDKKCHGIEGTVIRAINASMDCYQIPAIASAWRGNASYSKVDADDVNVILSGRGLSEVNVQRGDRVVLTFPAGDEIGVTCDRILHFTPSLVVFRGKIAVT